MLAVISVSLLLSGAVSLLLAYFPRYNETPRSPIWIWAGPTNDMAPDLGSAIVSVNLTNQRIDIQFDFTPSRPADFTLTAWVPYQVLSVSSQFDGYPGPTPISIPLDDGGTWLSINRSATPKVSKEIDIIFNVLNLFSFHEPGKDVAIFTFWGGIGPFSIRDQKQNALVTNLQKMNSDEVFTTCGFSLFVIYPNRAVLAADTFPPPNWFFSSSGPKWAVWYLNFTSPFRFGQSVYVSITFPDELVQRDIMFFLGGLFSGTGAGGTFESLRDYLRSKGRRELARHQSFCMNCGHQLEPRSKFCNKCGSVQ